MSFVGLRYGSASFGRCGQVSCVFLGRGVLNCVTVRQARSVALSYTRVWQCRLRYGKAGMVSCGRLGLGLFGSGRCGALLIGWGGLRPGRVSRGEAGMVCSVLVSHGGLC